MKHISEPVGKYSSQGRKYSNAIIKTDNSTVYQNQLDSMRILHNNREVINIVNKRISNLQICKLLDIRNWKIMKELAMVPKATFNVLFNKESDQNMTSRLNLSK